MSGGFLKLVRGRDVEDLFRDPLAYTLLSLIAYRARRSEGFDVHGLEPGEALIGDHESVGMTRKQYRVRLNRLVCGGFVAIRRADRGTIAKVLDTRIFDINADEGGHQNGHQRAIERPSEGHRRATNKKDKKDKNEKMKESLSLVETDGAKNAPVKRDHDAGERENDFETFWIAYPRKDGKAAARKAWEQTNDRPAVDHIVKAIRVGKKSQQWKQQDGRFIPTPTNWILDRRWEDIPVGEIKKAAPPGPSCAHEEPPIDPTPQPVTEEEQAEMAKELAQLRAKAGV
jgi:hypothetical protein